MLRTRFLSLTRTPWFNLTAGEFSRGGPSRLVRNLLPVANENPVGNLTASEFSRVDPSQLVADLVISR